MDSMHLLFAGALSTGRRLEKGMHEKELSSDECRTAHEHFSWPLFAGETLLPILRHPVGIGHGQRGFGRLMMHFDS
jgi:hypothetical protein